MDKYDRHDKAIMLRRSEIIERTKLMNVKALAEELNIGYHALLRALDPARPQPSLYILEIVSDWLMAR